MAEPLDNREYLIIPTPEELASAKEEYRALVSRRAARGQTVTDEDGQKRVSGFLNSDQILAANPHIQEDITAMGTSVAVNLAEGRIGAERVFELGARYILEMFAIATTIHVAKQIEREI